ncbi:MAG: hypothetical protein IKI68_05235, partial [Clostridia bacterium]|nr:hypothetical protein [Clostridia bacterium]
IIFLTAIVFMFLCCYIDINKRTIHFILKFNVIIGYMYLIAYRFAPRINNFSVGLDFNFGNPNFAGMWLFQSLLYCTLAFVIYRQPIMKIFSGVPIVMLLYYINKTGARNCELAYLLFIAVCIWFKTKKCAKIPKWVVILINVIPIVFVPLYLNFVKPLEKLGWLNFIVSEGKTLSSRVKIWTHFFDKLGSRWLTGEYLTCLGNSHNSHMVVLCSYGIITLALVICFTYNISMIANEKANDKRSGYCLAAFFATLFMGLGEGALFAGGIGLYIMGCSFICMARYDFSDFDTLDYAGNKIGFKRIYDEGHIKKRKISLR